MTSSGKDTDTNTSDWSLKDWLDVLQLQLGATEDLLQTYFSRDDSYFTRLASDETQGRMENPPDQLRDTNRRIVLKQLIHSFRPLKKILLKLDPEIPIAAIDLLIDELWEIERGGKNRLLIRPAGEGRGSRSGLATSLHRAPLIVAYDRLLKEGQSKQSALNHLADRTGLKAKTIGQTVKDFHEKGKDDDSLQLYRKLPKETGSSDLFISLYMQRIVSQWG
jgi:hypothetical protein